MRTVHLKCLLKHLIPILIKQKLRFKIFLINQKNSKQEFNRGMLLNAGYDIVHFKNTRSRRVKINGTKSEFFTKNEKFLKSLELRKKALIVLFSMTSIYWSKMTKFYINVLIDLYICLLELIRCSVFSCKK